MTLRRNLIQALSLFLLFFPVITPASESAPIRCLKDEVKALRAEGVSSADRRLKILGSVDPDQVRRRVEAARDSNATQLFIPEFRNDVRWARTGLAKMEEKILAILDDAVANPQKQPEKVAYLFEKRSPEQTKKEIREYAELLRRKLNTLINDPRGVSYPDWIAVTKHFAEFASMPYWEAINILNFITSGGPFFSYKKDLASLVSKEVTPWSWKSHVEEYGEWIPILTTQKTDIPTINEWMSKGMAPVALRDKQEGFDGSPPTENPNFIREHDFTHIGDFGKRDTGIPGLSPQEYFQKFRKALAGVKDERLKSTIEVRWFYVYHETFGFGERLEYSPRFLLRIVNDPDYSTVFLARMRPNDLGDAIPGGYADLPLLQRADSWLKDFAKSVTAAQ